MQWQSNLVVCIRLVPYCNRKATAVASLITDTALNKTGTTLTTINGINVLDHSALTVAKELQFEEEGCGMHIDNKLGASAVGALFFTKKRTEMNPFSRAWPL